MQFHLFAYCLLICPSAWSSLLLNPLSVFFSHCILQLSNFLFVDVLSVHPFFSWVSWASLLSLLWILYQRDYLSLYQSLSCFFEVLIFFVWNIFLFPHFVQISSFCVLSKASTSLTFEGIALCSSWSSSFSPALTLGCLSNFYHCINFLIYSWYTPIVEGVLELSVFQEEGSYLTLIFRLIG